MTTQPDALLVWVVAAVVVSPCQAPRPTVAREAAVTIAPAEVAAIYLRAWSVGGGGGRPAEYDYCYSVALSSGGEAVWDGLAGHARLGRFVGTFDSSRFAALVEPLVRSEPFALCLSGATLPRVGMHTESALIRVRLRDGRRVELKDRLLRRNIDPATSIAAYSDAVEAFAESVDWEAVSLTPSIRR